MVKLPVKRGSPTVAMPGYDIRILDDWDTMGMRATQSRTTVLDGAFAASDRAASMTGAIANLSAGALVSRRLLPPEPSKQVDSPCWARALRSPASKRWSARCVWVKLVGIAVTTG